MKLADIKPLQIDEGWREYIRDPIIAGLIGLTALTTGAIGWGIYTNAKETAYLERVEDRLAQQAKASFDPGGEFKKDYEEHLRLKKAAEKLVMVMMSRYDASTKTVQVVPTYVRNSEDVQAYSDHVKYMMDKYQVRVSKE